MQTKSKNWFLRHKVLSIVLVVLLVIAVAVFFVVRNVMKNAEGLAYTFVRTTTLEKTTLTDSVTVNGTVKAGQDASVTVADAAKLYKVATVNVKVGDAVKKGDVIATLDTTELLKQIEQAELSYSDTLKSAQTSYARAADDLTVEQVKHENTLIDLQANIDAADKQLAEAQENQKKAQANYDAAKSDRDALAGEYNRVSAEVQAYTDQLKTAAAAQESALAEANNALAARTAAQTELEQAKSTYGEGSAEAIAAQQKLTECETRYTEANNAYTSAQSNYTTAATNLQNAQSGCSVPSRGLYGFAAIEAAFKQADSLLTQYETALETAKKTTESAEKALKSAHDAYDNEKNYSSLKTRAQNVEDAATRLSQSARTPSTLETLRDTLNSCTLTATMDGTITSLNATVGSVCTGAVATIQNTDQLTVEVTIPANSVPNVSEGMACRITSDAASGQIIHGTLVRIDPVANEKGTFGATVSVNASDAGLLIGTQAKVEIVISEKSDVFIVPMDAVDINDDGSYYVLRCTGGEGIAMTFEQVPVAVGDSNDYYVEISGAGLHVGDVIRSSTNLNEGIESSSALSMPGSSNSSGNGEPQEAAIAFTIEEE
uniref:efflux RND transporter periplasmic adaptor subunit n=1 Tax=Gemmiger formicilis TaxID=745368 RepID=UPI003FEFF50D